MTIRTFFLSEQTVMKYYNQLSEAGYNVHHDRYVRTLLIRDAKTERELLKAVEKYPTKNWICSIDDILLPKNYRCDFLDRPK